MLVGEEPEPYDRPPLSKAVLRGEAEPNSTRIHPQGWYGDNDVEVIAERTTALDPQIRRLEANGYESVDQLRGPMSYATTADPSAFERANTSRCCTRGRHRPT